MPRYFFNLHGVDDVFDRVGVELPTGNAVRMHMLERALDVMGVDENKPKQWEIEALDEAGRIVCSMEFGVED